MLRLAFLNTIFFIYCTLCSIKKASWSTWSKLYSNPLLGTHQENDWIGDTKTLEVKGIVRLYSNVPFFVLESDTKLYVVDPVAKRLVFDLSYLVPYQMMEIKEDYGLLIITKTTDNDVYVDVWDRKGFYHAALINEEEDEETRSGPKLKFLDPFHDIVDSFCKTNNLTITKVSNKEFYTQLKEVADPSKDLYTDYNLRLTQKQCISKLSQLRLYSHEKYTTDLEKDMKKVKLDVHEIIWTESIKGNGLGKESAEENKIKQQSHFQDKSSELKTAKDDGKSVISQNMKIDFENIFIDQMGKWALLHDRERQLLYVLNCDTGALGKLLLQDGSLACLISEDRFFVANNANKRGYLYSCQTLQTATLAYYNLFFRHKSAEKLNIINLCFNQLQNSIMVLFKDPLVSIVLDLDNVSDLMCLNRDDNKNLEERTVFSMTDMSSMNSQYHLTSSGFSYLWLILEFSKINLDSSLVYASILSCVKLSPTRKEAYGEPEYEKLEVNGAYDYNSIRIVCSELVTDTIHIQLFSNGDLMMDNKNNVDTSVNHRGSMKCFKLITLGEMKQSNSNIDGTNDKPLDKYLLWLAQDGNLIISSLNLFLKSSVLDELQVINLGVENITSAKMFSMNNNKTKLIIWCNLARNNQENEEKCMLREFEIDVAITK